MCLSITSVGYADNVDTMSISGEDRKRVHDRSFSYWLPHGFENREKRRCSNGFCSSNALILSGMCTDAGDINPF